MESISKNAYRWIEMRLEESSSTLAQKQCGTRRVLIHVEARIRYSLGSVVICVRPACLIQVAESRTEAQDLFYKSLITMCGLL